MSINKENRSLSPHLYIYKPQVTSVISIFHRISGSVLALILLFVPLISIFIDSFFSFNYFYFFYVLFSFLLKIVIYVLIATLSFHSLNGVRHIMWDLGIGLDLANLFITGCFVVTLSLILSFIIIIL